MKNIYMTDLLSINYELETAENHLKREPIDYQFQVCGYIFDF